MYPKEVKDHPKHLVSIKDLFHFLKSKVSLKWHTYLSLLRFFQIYRGNLINSFKFKVGMFALTTAVYFQLDPQIMMELLTVSSLMFMN